MRREQREWEEANPHLPKPDKTSISGQRMPVEVGRLQKIAESNFGSVALKERHSDALVEHALAVD